MRVQAALHELGDTLAPKEPWGEWGAQLRVKPSGPGAESDRTGGLRAIVMEQTTRPDGHAGHIRAQLQPSSRHRPGVYMTVNDEYRVEAPEKQIGSKRLLSLIKGEFDVSIGRSKWIIQQVLGK